MGDAEFIQSLSDLKKYLEKEKMFIQDPVRMKDVDRAMEILNALFPDAAREIKDDPLQLGAVILEAKAPVMIVRGQRELNLFAELTQLIDNFEFYSDGEDLHFTAVMEQAMIRIQ